MRWLRLAVLLCAAAAPGCRKQESSAAPADVATVLGSAPAGNSSDAGVPRYTITAEKLDGFVRYQEAMVAIYASMFKELEKLGVKPDGPKGPQRSAKEKQALALFQNKAQAEEKAREQAALSPLDVREIEQVVHDVIATRTVAKSFRGEDLIRQMEQMREKMPADQQSAFATSIANMKNQQAEFQNLSEARRKYGAANVDRVLSREDMLSKNWNAWMNQLAGERR